MELLLVNNFFSQFFHRDRARIKLKLVDTGSNLIYATHCRLQLFSCVRFSRLHSSLTLLRFVYKNQRVQFNFFSGGTFALNLVSLIAGWKSVVVSRLTNVCDFSRHRKTFLSNWVVQNAFTHLRVVRE